MMSMMKKGELDEKKIMMRLDVFLTKDIDRKLFELKSVNPQSKKDAAVPKK